MIEGHLLTPEGWRRGRLHWHEGRLTALQGEPVTEAQARADTGVPLVLPGFVDLHLHGGGGADTMDAGDAVACIARLHARFGTTSLLATTMTAPLDDLQAALRALAPACAQRPAGTARVLGVHLEGPYISPGKLGAQPPFTRPPSLQEILALHALAPIRLVTLAPEVEGSLALIPALVGAGMRVQIGHTTASYEQALAARSIEVQAGFANARLAADAPATAQEARKEFLASDVSCGIDLFFGGGSYDFIRQAQAGRLVPSRILQTHPDWFKDDIIPFSYAGEPFWDKQGRWIGNVLSSYGILYNRDALKRLGIARAPEQWEDLTDPRYVGEIALADPTKSSSIAKAFENLIQQQMQQRLAALRAAGVRFSLEPTDSGVCRLAVVLDPDGNAVTIHKRNPAQS